MVRCRWHSWWSSFQFVELTSGLPAPPWCPTFRRAALWAIDLKASKLWKKLSQNGNANAFFGCCQNVACCCNWLSLSLPFSMRRKQSGYESWASIIFDNNQKYDAFPPSSSLFLLVSKSPQWVVHLQLLWVTRPFSRLSSPHQTKLKLMIYLLAMFGEKSLSKESKMIWLKPLCCQLCQPLIPFQISFVLSMDFMA